MFGRAAAGYSGSEFRVSGLGVKGFGLGGLGFSGWGLVFIGLLGLGVGGLGVLGLRAYGGLWSSRVCMCECTAEVVNPETRPKKYEIHPHTHTHTHIYGARSRVAAPPPRPAPPPPPHPPPNPKPRNPHAVARSPLLFSGEPCGQGSHRPVPPQARYPRLRCKDLSQQKWFTIWEFGR